MSDRPAAHTSDRHYPPREGEALLDPDTLELPSLEGALRHAAHRIRASSLDEQLLVSILREAAWELDELDEELPFEMISILISELLTPGPGGPGQARPTAAPSFARFPLPEGDRERSERSPEPVLILVRI